MTTSTRTPNPVTWFEIHTANPERAKAFYGAVFGWTFDDAAPGYTMIGLGEGAADRRWHRRQQGRVPRPRPLHGAGS